MRLLVFTNLYPGEDAPRHGIFVEERLRQLVATGELTAEVIALRPLSVLGPWFSAERRQRTEQRHGITVHYVPVPTAPLVSNWFDPLVWANATRNVAARIVGQHEGPWIIDAHFLYPDGVAAVMLGEKLDLPVVMSARGSDVNVKLGSLAARWAVKSAASQCAALITVSRALAERLKAAGIAADKLHVLPNGVDLQAFCPSPDDRAYGLDGARDLRLLSVGHLLPDKGHHLAIEALQRLPGAHLTIVGTGPQENGLRRLAAKLGLEERVTFAGLVAHADMPACYRAADVLLLPSKMEGMPNVVLESIACGTPVVATAVGGIPEVLAAPEAGALVADRSVDALVAGVEQLLASGLDRQATRAFAEQHLGWDRTVREQLRLYAQVASVGRDVRASSGASPI